MATYKRLPRGKQKSTNEFVGLMERMERWVMAHFREVAIGAVVFVAILCTVFGVSRYMGWREAKAEDALARATRIENQQERQSALMNVAENFGSTVAVREALALLGNEAFSDGKYDDALRWFNSLANKSGSYPMLETYALHQQGAAYGELGQWDKAKDSYHEAGLLRGNIIKSDSNYREALSLEKLGKYDEARAIYKQIVDNSKGTDEVLKAKSEERILWLLAHQGSQG